MTNAVLQLAEVNLAAPTQHYENNESVACRVKHLARIDRAISEALAEMPLRFSLVKLGARRIHFS